MNVLITGSRKLINVDFIFGILRKELKEGDIIIHGGANGVDNIVQTFCRENNFHQVVMKPIYPSKKEYYLHRNAEMVGMCDRVIALWDGKSRGTDFTIRYARARNFDVKVFKEKQFALPTQDEGGKGE